MLHDFTDDEFDDDLDEFDDDRDGDESDEDDDERGVELRVDEIDDPVAHLLRGDIEIEGRMPYSSNATFLVHVVHEGRSHPAIYKPLRGERPLWDFEPGLHRREVATYLLNRAMGLDVVPPTVLRDGPLGEGSLQWFVVGDHSQHYFTIHERHPELHDQLRDIAALDFVTNNTDRKSGHCILTPPAEGRPGRVWAIDHGLTFSADFKLRTVIWEFAGEPLPEHLLVAAARLHDTVPLEVATLLADEEVAALQRRAGWMITERCFPSDPTGRRYPWPLV